MNDVSRMTPLVMDNRFSIGLIPRQEKTSLADVRPTEIRESSPRPPPLRSIVVPIDGSHFAEHALPYAMGLAKDSGATVHLVHVFSASEAVSDPMHLMVDFASIARQRTHREEYLEGLTRQLSRAYPDISVTGMLRESVNVVQALGEAAKEADLVVMAAHRRGAWSRFWRGSVAEQVLRSLTCPLLLIRGREEPLDFTRHHSIRNILVPLDGTERTEAAIASATRLGADSGAHHELLRVIRAWNFFGSSAHGCGGMMPLPGEQTEAEAREYLADVATRLHLERFHVRGRVVVDDRPIGETILGNAERLAADVIAMTTRNRGRFSRLFHESITESVIHNASVPILLTRVP